nr:phosphopantothenoylcysteine decarboxylase isoform X5 [Manis javanica]
MCPFHCCSALKLVGWPGVGNELLLSVRGGLLWRGITLGLRKTFLLTSETCVIRAWDPSKPLLFCPAMNTTMWEHPVTARQVDQLKAFGYVEIQCVAKKLVCGDQGLGAMAEVSTIVDKVKEVLSWHCGSQKS